MPYPSKQNELYERVLRDLSKCPPGSRIPSERALTGRYGVARMTLRKTLDRLVQEKRIVRRVRGSFVLGKDRAFPEPEGNKEEEALIHVLLPCPEFSFVSGRYSLYIADEVIRGAMSAAVCGGMQVVTIPVTLTNDPEEINWAGLSRLGPGDVVLFAGNWYEKLYPFLVERRCRVGAILPKDPKVEEMFLRSGIDCRICSRPILMNYVPEILSVLKEKACRRILLFTRENFSLELSKPEHWPRELENLKRSAAPAVLTSRSCPHDTGFAEQCAMIRAIFEREGFDALIFDSETDPGFPVSLHRLCHLPPGVPVFVRGSNLVGSGRNVWLTRSGFRECSREMASFFFSGEKHGTGERVTDFRHIVIPGESVDRYM